MTRTLDMVVPPTGEALDAARLVAWIVAPGQAFKTGDVLVEIETDKSIIEVPAHDDGIMVEHLVAVDGIVNADTVIARVQMEGEAAPAASAAGVPAQPTAATPAAAAAAPAAARAPAASPSLVRPLAQPSGERKFATPAARRVAAERGIALDAVAGTGPNGRVTVADVGLASGNGREGMLARGAPGAKREDWAATRHGEIRFTVWEGSRPDSQTAVLIHGMFGDRDAWASLAHALSRAGLRVLAMDLPCHGATRSQATRFEHIVDAVADTVASQCIGSVNLIGHSFGAAVAARAASRPGMAVDSLVLIAPVGLGTEIDQSFLTGMTHAGTNEAAQRELQKLTVSGMTPSGNFIDALRQSTQARREPLIELCREVGWNGVQQLSIAADLASLQCRCTLIHGRRDAVIPWRHALNAPARTALHLLPDAGHMPQWEAGKLVADIVLEAFTRQAPGSPYAC
ncbi:alpha/beta fold hydrolase [Achromobacter sp. ACM03]|uniref:alpha/beta fold hydrolase n=1 Tax=Achromobacter sp. ACM03 TaxID=2769300 RepID=UPI00178154D5|nr:alpha/beta fold hydrolase [Achromobacter sp. ACM03]MBD9431593.1 alpha/beta fold hydrolase [Achromobacter sp. ACM03]